MYIKYRFKPSILLWYLQEIFFIYRSRDKKNALLGFIVRVEKMYTIRSPTVFTILSSNIK